MLILAAAIVDSLTRPTRVLCAQRSAPPELNGKWEFPGGKQEPNESPETGVIREISEELGVQISLGEIFRNDASADGDWPLPNGKPMRLWLATTEENPEPLQDHHELRWMSFPQLHELDWLPGDLPIVARMQQMFWGEFC